MPNGKFAVIGLGRFGSSIAKKLSDKGADVLCIDNDKGKIDTLKELSLEGVVMDSTVKSLLISQNIQEMDAVVVSIGENFEALLMTTFILKELNIKRILVRARQGIQKNILEKIGVTEILCPEEEVGNTITEKLINPKVLEYVHLGGEYELVEVIAPQRYIGSTIFESNIRNKYNINIVTILRKNNSDDISSKETIGVPNIKTKIQKGDILLLFGKFKDIEKFTKVNN